MFIFTVFLLVYYNLQNYFPRLSSFILMIMDSYTVNIMFCIDFFLFVSLGKIPKDGIPEAKDTNIFKVFK